MSPRHYDVIVVGTGLSGLVAAATLAEAGARIYIVGKGGGYLHFLTGCVDVLGKTPDGEPVDDPLSALPDLSAGSSGHPYALAGPESLEQGADLFQRVVTESGTTFEGDLHHNRSLPTAIGSVRTTCLTPASMTTGDLSDDRPMLIAGFRHFRDFYPPYLAANLAARTKFAVRAVYLDIPSFGGRHHLLPTDVVRALDDPSLLQEISIQVKANLSGAGRVGFPAVLGMDSAHETWQRLQEMIGLPVFEIPTLPPSVPGMRLHQAFRTYLLRRGVRMEIGFWASGTVNAGRAGDLAVGSAGHLTHYAADAYILATGGIGSRGIEAQRNGTLRETVFGLPVEGPKERTAWAHHDFLTSEPHPISLAGIRTNERLQPIGVSGDIVENVFVTASNLPGWDPTREGSGEGVALATGSRAAREAFALVHGHDAAPATSSERPRSMMRSRD